MLTQCPGCQTVFRVTGAILRAAHGQVRCGKCSQQFDAIAYLQDQEESDAQESNVEVTESPPESSTGLPGISHEDIVLEGHRIEISGIYDRLSPADGKSHLALGHIIEEFNPGSEQWENPFAETEAAIDTATETVTHADDPAADPEEAPVTDVEDIEVELDAVSLVENISSLDTDSRVDVQVDTGEHITIEAPSQDEDETSLASSESASAFSPGDSQRFAAARTLTDLPTPDEALLAPEEAGRRWPWWLASVAMVLLLVSQAVDHWRESLARRPGFGPALIRLYSAFGQSLTPEWQLAAYRVKQWGIVSDPAQPGTLQVRASVTNEAAFAQPYPVLRLVLEDRFGAKVGQRDFTAREYMSAPPPQDRLLDAAASANVDLTLVDPGSDAVGFQLDSCLPRPGGLACTHDQLPP